MSDREKRTYSAKLREAGIASPKEREVILSFLDRLSDILIEEYMQRQYGEKAFNSGQDGPIRPAGN